MKQRILHRLALAVLTVVMGLPGAGCKSLDQPASASFASVEISGHTADQIRAATVVVFQQDGYSSQNLKRKEMVFEKEGSRWDQIAYGDWVISGGVWIRVKAAVVPLADGRYRLECTAYRLTNKGTPTFEEEVRFTNARSKPFQALLDKVAQQLRRS